jgi:hypothetical protein
MAWNAAIEFLNSQLQDGQKWELWPIDIEGQKTFVAKCAQFRIAMPHIEWLNENNNKATEQMQLKYYLT